MTRTSSSIDRGRRVHAKAVGSAILATASWTASARADTFDWIPPGGGSFGAPTNWSPAGGPPGATDTARFLVDSPSTSTVTFVGNVSNEFLFVDALGWTFDLGGQAWSITGDFPCATFDGEVTMLDGTLLTQWSVAGGSLSIAADAQWHNVNGVFLPGDSLLEVEAGASLLSGWIDVSGGPSGAAILVAAGPGALASCPASVLVVGSSGAAELHVLDGAVAESLWGEIGAQVGSSGEVVVGGGGAWNMPGSFTAVGVAGSGALLVTDGGEVTTGFLGIVADLAGSDGSAELIGAALWNIAGELVVADGGAGTLHLTTAPGLGDPVVTTAGALRVGVESTAAGHVLVDGIGARAEVGSFAVVGQMGEGEVTLGLGAEVAIGGPLALGELPSGIGHLTIDGNFAQPAPPLLHVDGYLAVGVAGSGSLLAMTQGHILAESCIIAVEPGSTGEVSLLFGPDLTLGGPLEVGRGGGGLLTIDPFSAASCLSLSAGGESGSSGAVAMLLGSITTTDGAISLGIDGVGSLSADQGSQIHVLGGGDGIGGLVVLGTNAGSNGSLVLADAGTLLDATAQVVCASSGLGTLSLVDGAELRARKSNSPSGSACIVGLDDGSDGEAVVEAGGHLNCLDGALVVGFREGATGSLRVDAGGLVSSVGGFVGRQAGSEGTVHLAGRGTNWECAGELQVGEGGSGSMEVSTGAAVTAPLVRVGASGTLAGDGTIEGDVENSGVVAPGASTVDSTIGSLLIEGGYAQSAEGRLVLEVGGASPGQWDRLLGNFTDFFELGGTLELVLVEGYVPSGGEQLVVLAGGFMANTFETLVGPVPFTFLRGETVGIVTFCLPADLNCDGVVNGGDLGLQLAQWGGPGTGDLNHDGVVDGADVGLLLAAWTG